MDLPAMRQQRAAAETERQERGPVPKTLTFIGDWKKPSEKKRREKKGAKEDADAATASAQPDPGQFGYPPQYYPGMPPSTWPAYGSMPYGYGGMAPPPYGGYAPYPPPYAPYPPPGAHPYAPYQYATYPGQHGSYPGQPMAGPAPPGPPSPDEADDELANLLMAWYWTGFYTGRASAGKR
jgi:hypothetical protein